MFRNGQRCASYADALSGGRSPRARVDAPFASLTEPSLHVGNQLAIAAQHQLFGSARIAHRVETHPNSRHRPQIGRDIEIDVEPGVNRARSTAAAGATRSHQARCAGGSSG